MEDVQKPQQGVHHRSGLSFNISLTLFNMFAPCYSIDSSNFLVQCCKKIPNNMTAEHLQRSNLQPATSTHETSARPSAADQRRRVQTLKQSDC